MNALAVTLALLFTADRPDTPDSDELFRFDDGDVVESFDTDRFRVHFARAGTHAVPLADDDSSGVPDHVEQIGLIYEDVLAFYTDTLGYRAPLGDGGTDPLNDDARFDVYLVDFGFSADGAFRAEACADDKCAGFMVQENDFAGYGYPSVTYANRLLASHEFFHAVQAAYDFGQSAVIGEGTAVWASEQFDASLDDLEGFGLSYLAETSRPLNADGSGPVDPFNYGTAIWFEHIAQAHGDDVVRAIWEAIDAAGGASAGADWFDVLDGVIVAAGGTGFADDFVSFATSTIGDVEPEPLTLPFSQSSFLTFIASWHTVSFSPSGRAQVRIAVVGEGIDVDGIHLVVAPDGATPELVEPSDSGGVGGDLVRFDVTRDSTQSFFRAQIINTRQDGNGSRPRLCIGSTEEVDACIAEELDPGEGEGEGEASEGEGEGGDGNDAPSCACASANPADRSGAAFAALALVLVALLLGLVRVHERGMSAGWRTRDPRKS